MTEAQAVAHLVKAGVIKWAHEREKVRSVVEACVATAKAEAKEAETRRCAARVLHWKHPACGSSTELDRIANDLLTTGGLGVKV